MSYQTSNHRTSSGIIDRVPRRSRANAHEALPTTRNVVRDPLVTVVIATMDGERFLAQTLESVLAQTWQELEIIVCDDGSSDGTQELLAGYRDRVLVHRQPNRGVSFARNRGADFARGQYLAFLDHDDLWEPDMLERQLGVLTSRADYGLVYGDSWIIDQAGASWGRRRSYLDYNEGLVYSDLLRGNFIPIETAVMPTEVFRGVGGFDERLHYLEDYELYLRIARRHPVAFQPHPVARYRIHEGNLSHDKEALLVEWVAVLDALLGDGNGRAPEERAIIEGQRARRCAEVAWQALRRGDVRDADTWLDRAGDRCPSGLRMRVRAARGVLAALPRPVADRLMGLLPRRRLYGL